MELILLESIKNVGDLGDTVQVKSGFGRNYLLPTGRALRATAENQKVFDDRKADLVKKAQDSLNAAKLRAGQLEGATITIHAMASEEGKLYGSVGAAEIVRAASEQGLDLEKQEIDLPAGAIHALGDDYTAIASLHSEVEVELKIVVEPEAS